MCCDTVAFIKLILLWYPRNCSIIFVCIRFHHNLRSSNRAATRAYTGRFFETRWSPETVILSAAKDLRLAQREIQSSRSEPALERSEGMTHPPSLAPFLKNLPV